MWLFRLEIHTCIDHPDIYGFALRHPTETVTKYRTQGAIPVTTWGNPHKKATLWDDGNFYWMTKCGQPNLSLLIVNEITMNKIQY